MLDEIERSLRRMFHSAAMRASEVDVNHAHIVGEVHAERWYSRYLPPLRLQKFEWLLGAMAVLPTIPLGTPDPVFFSPSSLRAVSAARYIVGEMIRQIVLPVPAPPYRLPALAAFPAA